MQRKTGRRPWRMPLSLTAAWLMLAASASAQGLSGETLALKDAIEAAWARQPEARSASQRRDAATAQRRVSEGWMPEPAVLETSWRTDRFTRNNGAREIEVGVAVPLWLPGERSRSQELADAEVAALDARQRGALWRTAGAVRETWWTVQMARQDVAAAHTRLSSADRLATDVSRRARAGDLARVDQHQADAAVAAAQAGLAIALAAQAQSLSALRSLVGAAVPANVEQLSVDSEAEPAAPVSIDAQHPAVAEWERRADASRRAQALARAQTRAHPELTLLTTRERGAVGERHEQSVTIGVRIPFGNDARNRGKVAGAAADFLEAEGALEIERDKLGADVQTARMRLAAVRTALQAHERRAQLARETRGFIEKSFRLGESDLPTRLRVELEAVEAERQALRARVEQAHAISSLRQALGLLPP